MTKIIDDDKVWQSNLSPELRSRMVADGFEEILAWRLKTQHDCQDAPSVQSPNGTPDQTAEAPPVRTRDGPLVQPSSMPPDAPTMEPAAEDAELGKKTIDAAARQRAQTHRDEGKGWARCYAKAPDDPDAREIVAVVAKAIESLSIRRAVRLAVVHPQYVFVGAKIAGMGGIRGIVVRRLIGAQTT
jgi:hypothetical protein